MTTARLFRVTGLVQGVGFRPTVHRIARELALAGEVFNDAEGVGVILEGPEEAVLRFPEVLRAQKPPLARIDDVVMTEVPATGRTEFTITKTKGGRVRTGITADAATCATPSRTAPTAARASRSRSAFPTTARRRRWRPLRCVPTV